jgi:hypothetical protein
MLMTLAGLAACGSGQASTPSAASHQTGTSVDDKALSKADLERAAITDADLDGYKVERALANPKASRRTADPAACAPVVQSLGTSSGYAATARIARMIFPKKQGPGATMSLSSHSAGDAVRVIDAIRAAAKRCKTFKDIQVDFGYEAVELQPDPGYGDESVSLRLTQLAADTEDEEPIRVPCAVVAVRQGTTVAMFYTFNNPSRPWGKGPAVVPDALVRAQLGELGTSK